MIRYVFAASASILTFSYLVSNHDSLKEKDHRLTSIDKMDVQNMHNDPIYFRDSDVPVGDPNPIYADGTYTIFYLRNEEHHPLWVTQTKDLIHWSKPREALPGGGAEAHDFWIGSGSVIADPAGGYKLYYTGHNSNIKPGEVVMSAHASSLLGPWKKDNAFLSAPPTLSNSEFRDPFVTKDPYGKAYQMLISGRSGGTAMIVLYRSNDLQTWALQKPLYDAPSASNIEVPDFFNEAGRSYVIYSDQRDQSRQVRYLIGAGKTGSFHPPSYDTLDGRGFYAGKSAGPGKRRIIFGWVPSKSGNRDTGASGWGGTLVYHTLQQNGHGDLAVALPEQIRSSFKHLRIQTNLGGTQSIVVDQPLLISMVANTTPTTSFGLRFAQPLGSSARILIDPKVGKALFALDQNNAPQPSVSFPSTTAYRINIVLDPNLGVGIAYINSFRALSFRYYGLKQARLSVIDGTPSRVRLQVFER